jgi:hypothetical protein
MPITTVPAYSIQLIDAVSRADGGVQVAFRDGSRAWLDSGQANFEHLLWLAEWSRPSRPVGVVMDAAGRILDLNAAHETGVAWVREFPTDRNRFRVAFWAFSPLCGLTREHPEFERIFATLTAAAGTQQPLWVVTQSEETVDDEPDEEGLIAALPKIMVVGSMNPLPSTNGEPFAGADRPRE